MWLTILIPMLTGLVAHATVRGQDEVNQQAPEQDDRNKHANSPDRSSEPARTNVQVPPTVQFVPDVVYAQLSVASPEVVDTRAHDLEGDRAPDAGEADTRDAPAEIKMADPPDVSPARELTMNVFFPKDSGGKPLPVVLYLHGGGFVSGSKESGNQLCAFLARGGYFACSIEYRLADEAPFPASIHDAKAAVRFLRANAAQLGIDPSRIGAIGHASGGHLATMLAVTANAPAMDGQLGLHVDTPTNITCAVSVAGPPDLGKLRQSRGLARQLLHVRGRITSDDLAKLTTFSPVHWTDDADAPLLLLHGEKDPLVPVEQVRAFALRSTQHGASVTLIIEPEAGHVVRTTPSTARVLAFLDQHLGGDATSVFQSTQRTQRLIRRLF